MVWLIKITTYEKLIFRHLQASVCQTRPSMTDSPVSINLCDKILLHDTKNSIFTDRDQALGIPLTDRWRFCYHFRHVRAIHVSLISNDFIVRWSSNVKLVNYDELEILAELELFPIRTIFLIRIFSPNVQKILEGDKNRCLFIFRHPI